MDASKMLSINHNCLKPGKTSKVMLVLQFGKYTSDPHRTWIPRDVSDRLLVVAASGNLTFGWSVTCPKAASKGLTIVMKGMDDKIFTAGNVNPSFSPSASVPYIANGNMTSFVLYVDLRTQSPPQLISRDAS